jgi:hypothetical protein
MRQLSNFVDKNREVNIMVMSAPPRYDLMHSSCVNNEVVIFNQQLKKILKIFNNVRILETPQKSVSQNMVST